MIMKEGNHLRAIFQFENKGNTNTGKIENKLGKEKSSGEK